ncbi:MAG TPA: signal peptidase I [Thermoanaerobaculia bacterium]|jgi:signal peptidase I|nr:signal peptidase I [Thermoanaerobaculia bacterium]
MLSKMYAMVMSPTPAGMVRTYRSTTGSMEPTLPIGDRMIAVRTGVVNRGDIVAFEYPLERDVVFAKRVVAVAGETVEIRAKRLLVNGAAVEEPYAVHLDPAIYPAMASLPEPYRSRDNFGPLQVPPGAYFVLGDNRDRSSDSRYWGVVPRENIKGRLVFLFSWSRGFRKL